MADNTILDLDAMFDVSMDSIETLPDFVTPPAGSYLLKVTEAKTEKYTPKEKQGEPKPKEAARIKIFYSVEKTIEIDKVNGKNELPVKDGSLFSESFMFTEDGLKYFKRQAINIMNVPDLSGATFKDVLDGLKGQEFMAKITIRSSDDGKGGKYDNVNVRPVHEQPAA